MIKGKYVAQIQFDFNITPEKKLSYVPFDKLKDVVMYGELSNTLKKLLSSELGGEGITCSVTQMYANVYECKEDDAPEASYAENEKNHISG